MKIRTVLILNKKNNLTQFEMCILFSRFIEKQLKN